MVAAFIPLINMIYLWFTAFTMRPQNKKVYPFLVNGHFGKIKSSSNFKIKLFESPIPPFESKLKSKDFFSHIAYASYL